MNYVKASLIRFATISSASSFNNEATPAIGLAYLASICKINKYLEPSKVYSPTAALLL